MDGSTLEALTFCGFVLGWTGRQMPLTIEGGETRWTRPPWLPDIVRRIGGENLDVSAGLACERPDIDTLTQTAVLWAWVEGSEQVAAAKRFRPAPSFVLRMGETASRRLLIWTMAEPIGAADAEILNRRIAYRLRAPQKWAALEALRVPLPGTQLKVGRKRPVPVVVTRMQMDGFDASFADRLREPPPRDAWRQRPAA